MESPVLPATPDVHPVDSEAWQDLRLALFVGHLLA